MQNIFTVLDRAHELYDSHDFVTLELIPLIHKLLAALERIQTVSQTALTEAMDKDKEGSERDQIVLCNRILEIIHENRPAH